MYIAKNLQYLRKREKLTQEELADKLYVSRQSVSKWETNEAYPDTDKLIAICDLFDVSLDALMRSDLTDWTTQEQSDETDSEKPIPALTDRKVYCAHIDKFSLAIALGVMLVIFGVAVCVALAGVSFGYPPPLSDTIAIMGGVSVLLFAAVAVFLFVFYGMRHERFYKSNPIADCPADEQTSKRLGKRFITILSCLIAAIIVDVAFLIIMTTLTETAVISVSNVDSAVCYITSAFFFVMSALVGGIVLIGIRKMKIDIDDYNKAAQRKLHPTARNKLADTISGVIMMTATALYFILGFVWSYWHPGWVVFPVGAIICGIVDKIINRPKD